MTLQDAVDKQFYESPEKRIVREPNNRGWCDVWFNYDIKLGKLVVNIYDMGFRRKVAPFQMSNHTDWILV